MDEYSITNTTKEQRIALIRAWVPDDEAMDGNDIDIWEMYRDYIDGRKEISECNAAFSSQYDREIKEIWKVTGILEADYGCEERTPGEKLKCIVCLKKESGEQKQILVEDEYLNKNEIHEGSEWVEGQETT